MPPWSYVQFQVPTSTWLQFVKRSFEKLCHFLPDVILLLLLRLLEAKIHRG